LGSLYNCSVGFGAVTCGQLEINGNTNRNKNGSEDFILPGYLRSCYNRTTFAVAEKKMVFTILLKYIDINLYPANVENWVSS
jgi:hypothetical protein